MYYGKQCADCPSKGEWTGKACGRTYMWYSAAGSQLMALAKQGQGVEKSECYIAENI